ncbi:hypothetical protein HDU81_009957 [Chytriomyces hyalinus]|nr:hypothetical protein HDU81_009957 [Chytriomyces hyalinus]
MQLLNILLIAAATPVFCTLVNQQQDQGEIQIGARGQVQQINNNGRSSQQFGNQQVRSGQVNRNKNRNQVYQQGGRQQVSVSYNSNQGLQWGQNIIISNQMLGSWGRQWNLNSQQVGQIISQMVSLPIQSNILLGCRQICRTQRISMVSIVQIARSCRTHIITQKRVRVIPRHHMIILNHAANVFIQQQRVVRRQKVVIVQRPPVRVQVTRIVIVQKVVQRVQVVSRRLRISESSMNWLMPYVMGNMVNWGCCGTESIDGFNGAISYKRDSDTGMMDMAVKMANDADMQSGMASVLEMLSDKASMLSTATTQESQQMIADAAKQMKMSEMAITNICAATASAMLSSNMTSGSELDAMVNCATSKDETFIPMEQINKDAMDASTSSAESGFVASTSSVTSEPAPTLTTDEVMSSTQSALTSTESALTTASVSTAQQMTTAESAPRYTTANFPPPSKLQASGTSAMAASMLLSAIISALSI